MNIPIEQRRTWYAYCTDEIDDMRGTTIHMRRIKSADKLTRNSCWKIFRRMISSLYSTEESSMSDDRADDSSWVEWFCRLRGNEFFVEVDQEYISDDFNLTGLSQIVPYYDEALRVILDDDDHDQMNDEETAALESATQMLYGLIHARFLQTNRGIHALYEKFSNGVYGTCWNEICLKDRSYVLPVGSDVIGHGSANVYCPKCGECYVPRSGKLQQLDGSYFGSSAAHMLVLQFSTSIPTGTTSPYVPSLYGFRIFPGIREQLRPKKDKSQAQLVDK